MRGGKNLCSARVLTVLTGEEKDQLDRSTKKPKQTTMHETFVEETQEPHPKEQVRVYGRKDSRELFPKTIWETMKWKLLSYKDACFGINGVSSYYSSSEWETYIEAEADDD
ncbi:hypothetical protein SESBI_43584 [Sesbania bispinosa]|nr:hypothetical protein SESBI_43584 [Sesbania bispinosa]